jgi:hypothetical protein
MYYKTSGACQAANLVQVDVLVHGACYSPEPFSSFSPKCMPGNAFKTEQVCLLSLSAPLLPAPSNPFVFDSCCAPPPRNVSATLSRHSAWCARLCRYGWRCCRRVCCLSSARLMSIFSIPSLFPSPLFSKSAGASGHEANHQLQPSSSHAVTPPLTSPPSNPSPHRFLNCLPQLPHQRPAATRLRPPWPLAPAHLHQNTANLSGQRRVLPQAILERARVHPAVRRREPAHHVLGRRVR